MALLSSWTPEHKKTYNFKLKKYSTIQCEYDRSFESVATKAFVFYNEPLASFDTALNDRHPVFYQRKPFYNLARKTGIHTLEFLTSTGLISFNFRSRLNVLQPYQLIRINQTVINVNDDNIMNNLWNTAQIIVKADKILAFVNDRLTETIGTPTTGPFEIEIMPLYFTTPDIFNLKPHVLQHIAVKNFEHLVKSWNYSKEETFITKHHSDLKGYTITFRVNLPEDLPNERNKILSINLDTNSKIDDLVNVTIINTTIIVQAHSMFSLPVVTCSRLKTGVEQEVFIQYNGLLKASINDENRQNPPEWCTSQATFSAGEKRRRIHIEKAILRLNRNLPFNAMDFSFDKRNNFVDNPFDPTYFKLISRSKSQTDAELGSSCIETSHHSCQLLNTNYAYTIHENHCKRFNGYTCQNALKRLACLVEKVTPDVKVPYLIGSKLLVSKCQSTGSLCDVIAEDQSVAQQNNGYCELVPNEESEICRPLENNLVDTVSIDELTDKAEFMAKTVAPFIFAGQENLGTVTIENFKSRNGDEASIEKIFDDNPCTGLKMSTSNKGSIRVDFYTPTTITNIELTKFAICNGTPNFWNAYQNVCFLLQSNNGNQISEKCTLSPSGEPFITQGENKLSVSFNDAYFDLVKTVTVTFNNEIGYVSELMIHGLGTSSNLLVYL